MPIDILWGLIGGLIATVVMTLFMAPLMARSDDPPLFAYAPAKMGGIDPGSKQAKGAGMLSHFLYGTIAGALFGLAWDPVIRAVDVAAITPLVGGVIFGVILFVVAVAAVVPILDVPEMPKAQVGAFFVAHLVYGAVLGSVAAWLGGVAVV